MRFRGGRASSLLREMHAQRQPTFRADVQGLRAIAVLTVIAGHAGVSFLPGGFVGVDVFFVISGFLISQLLFREVERRGSLSIRDFYARRARRILPAATLVTLATLAGSLVWLSVVDAREVVYDAAWATFFAANVRFSAVGTDYFAQETGPSPMQHYWSLSVEEQFYLVWPLLLLGCVWLARQRRHRGAGARVERAALPRLTVWWVLVGLGLVSFGYGVVLTETDPTAAYFSTPARAWELAIGAVTALVARHVAGRLGSVQRGAIATAGLVAIGWACVTYGADTPFPGTAAALPVLGSAALLLAGAGGHEREPLPIRALSVAPMRVVGDWSYSLYLWHWPLLIIPERRLGHDLGVGQTVSLVALTFVLSGLTYKYVETPFRSPLRLPRTRALALYPASVVLVVACCGSGWAYGQWKAGEFGDRPPISLSNFGVADEGDYKLAKDPTVALVQASVIAAENGMDVPSDLTPDVLKLRDDVPSVGDCDYENDEVRTLCPHGDVDADRSIVVYGNSHARMWIPAFERIARHSGYRTYYLVKPNCTATLVDVGDLANGGARWQGCTDFREWALDQIEELEPDLVAVSSSGPNPVVYDDEGSSYTKADPEYDELQRAGYEELFTRLKASAKRTVLIRDVPKSEQEPGTCLTTGSPDLGDCLFEPLASQEHDSDLSVEVAQETGTDYVDPTKWVCWKDRCPVVIGNVLPYRDRGHLTTVYAESLADDLGKEIGIWTS